MILSTLAELEDSSEEMADITHEPKSKIEETEVIKKEEVLNEEVAVKTLDDEREFCESMRERILVLFEGFQSPNNKSVESKIDLTLNFLEYSLATLDERLEKLDNR